MCLGAIIALAVVATGALRNAVEVAKLDPLPETFVVLYGAWFTAILGAIYLYVFGALRSAVAGSWMGRPCSNEAI